MRMLNFLLLAASCLLSPLVALFQVAFRHEGYGGHRPPNPTPRSIGFSFRPGSATRHFARSR
jgi:hypothetical protein